MNSGTIFEPYDRNFDPNGRYQGKANYNVILRDIISQPDEAFDEDLFPYYCYCYDSLHNKLSHVSSLSHDGNTFTIHSAPVSSDGYLKHFVSCVTALGPDMLVGNTERCTPSAFNDRIQHYNPLDVDFSAYRIGFSFLVKNTDTDNQDWIYSIDDLKELDSSKNIVVQTAGRLFFKIESTGDWGGFVNNDNSSSIIYNCNDRVLYAKSSARFTGSSGIDVVPHWTMGCLKNGTVVAANAEMNDADTGYLIAGVVNTVDGEIELPISEKYNFTDEGLVIEVIEDWDNRDRITITTRLTIEQTLKEIAYLGLIVCHYSGATESVYAGYIDSDGLATGELIPFEDWEETDSLNVKNQFMTEFPDLHIKPKPTPEPDDKDDIENMRNARMDYFGGNIGYYYVTPSEMYQLNHWLGSQEEYADLDVQKSVVSLKSYPIRLTSRMIINKRSQTTEGQPITIKFDRAVSTVNSSIIDSTNGVINLGEYTIEPKFNNFLDYAPYTTIQVYIPLFGWIPLDDKCMGTTIQCVVYVDIRTGSARCVIYSSGRVVAERIGMYGIDISMTNENNGVKVGAMIRNSITSVSSLNNMLTSRSSGSVIGYANSITNGAIATKQNYSNAYGSGVGDTSAWNGVGNCYIKIERPIADNSKDYAKRYGLPLQKTETLSNLTGFTKCENANINGNMTLEEKTMIENYLNSGVIL